MGSLNDCHSVLLGTRELHKQNLKDEVLDDFSTRTAPARVRRSLAPLSFAQQRLWFLDQLEPGIPLYNMATSFRLEGILNAEVLQKALAAVVTRHEACVPPLP